MKYSGFTSYPQGYRLILESLVSEIKGVYDSDEQNDANSFYSNIL